MRPDMLADAVVWLLRQEAKRLDREGRQIRTAGETADERIDAIDIRNSAAHARSMAVGIEAEVTQ